MNPDEMSNLMAAHALQSNESSENEQQLSQIDHTDSVDGESLNIFLLYKNLSSLKIYKKNTIRTPETIQ